MEFTKITEKNKKFFAKIMPSNFEQWGIRWYGCVVNQKAVASGGFIIGKEYCSIAWLWVAKEYRNQGIGTALLSYLCKQIPEEFEGNIIITYNTKKDWSVVIEYLLLKRDFVMEVYAYPKFSFTKQQLLEAPLVQKGELEHDERMKPLIEVTHLQKKELLSKSVKKGSYPITALDLGQMNEERSIAFVEKGEIQGLVLVGAGEEKDILSLNLLYLKKEARKAALMLLRHTAKRVLNHPMGLREFHFLCTDEISIKICRELMGKYVPEEEEYCFGRLWKNKGEL